MLEEGQGGIERRRGVRFERELPLRFLVFDSFSSDGVEENLRPKEGRISNISAGGVRISTTEIDEDTAQALKESKVKLALRFALEDGGKDINATAQVKWLIKANVDEQGRVKYIMGVEFLDINSEDRNRIIRFILSKRFPNL